LEVNHLKLGSAKVITRSGEEIKFDSKDIEDTLKAAGLPERVAVEVAERVEDRVEDRWTTEQVNEQVDLELRRLDEDIQRAESNYRKEAIRPAIRSPEEPELGTNRRSDTFIPETERERHDRY
jgi:hypothetical protein